MRESGCVLVVEDEDEIRETLREALQDEGCAVEAARDGREALALLDAFLPDVILLDMRMPVLDGWGFAREYRARPGRHAPIVVLTAAVSAEAWAEEIGAAGFVPKPFDFPRLYAELSRFTRCVQP